jgi:hypothetical protein
MHRCLIVAVSSTGCNGSPYHELRTRQINPIESIQIYAAHIYAASLGAPLIVALVYYCGD